jgi:phytoene/squalene synthetase
VPLARGLDLLTAFKQDAVKTRYADWEELLGYCVHSANPVGRFLLDLHGEPAAARPLSDALCTALQVLNHLQDLRDDYRQLDRVYLPESWLAAEGIGVESLAENRADPRLRRVIDRALDRVAELLPAASALPANLTDRRMAMEAGAIAALARALHARLRRQDPLAVRVELSKPAKLWVAGRGALAALRRPAPAPRTA